MTSFAETCFKEDLKTIAEDLGKTWKDLAKLLQIDKNEISAIESSCDDMNERVTVEWRKKKKALLTFSDIIEHGGEFKEKLEQLIIPDILKHRLPTSTDIVTDFNSVVDIVKNCFVINKSEGFGLQEFKEFEQMVLFEQDDPDSNKHDAIAKLIENVASSVDIELLEKFLDHFKCKKCRALLDGYKKQMLSSKYSEHKRVMSDPKVREVTCLFTEPPVEDDDDDCEDSAWDDPLCEVILKKKRFCEHFDVKPYSLRLLKYCRQGDIMVVIRWQFFADLSVFERELVGNNLKTLVETLKLRRLKVEGIALYFYVPTDTAESAKVSLKSGDGVLITSDTSDAVSLQEGHGGWNSDMEKILGQDAYVLQVDHDGDVLVYVPSVKRKYMLNPELVKSQKKTDVTVDIPKKEDLPKFDLGDVVVVCDLPKLIQIQSGHNGITDDMCQCSGEIAFVVHIHETEFVRADMLPMRRTFHPCTLTKIPKDCKTVSDGIKFLKDHVDWCSLLGKVEKVKDKPDDRIHLLLAAIFGDEDKMRNYLELYRNKVDTAVYKKHTALHLATLTGNESMVKLLLEFNADLKCKNDQGFTPLHFSTMSKFESIARVLLDAKGGDINIHTIGGFTPLMIAATNNEYKVVEFLCTYHGETTIDFGVKNAEGGTALHHAVEHSALQTARLLVEHDADPTIPNNSGHNCYHMAAIKGKEDIMEVMVKKYPQFVHYGDAKDITPLHWAGYHGHKNVVKIILEMTSIDIDTEDCNGGTPLLAATIQGHTNIIHQLIGYGADPNIYKKGSNSPLHALINHSGRLDQIKDCPELLKIKECFSDEIKSSLAEMSELKLVVICFLVEAGADLEAEGQKKNTTALAKIAKHEKQNVVEYIKTFSHTESSGYKGSLKRPDYDSPATREFWVTKHVANKTLECGHWLCEEHLKTEKKCPRCDHEPVKENKEAPEEAKGKVCRACLKKVNDDSSLGMKLAHQGDDDDDDDDNDSDESDEDDDSGLRKRLREMAASAAADAVQHSCHQQ